jgi:heme exporter protein A
MSRGLMCLSDQSSCMLAAVDLACLRGGRLVFAGLSFRLAAGGALVLSGPNGSGKSSLLRLLAGLGRPFAGQIDWPEAGGRPAYLGHQDAVKPGQTVAEALRFWAGYARPAAVAERVAAILTAEDLAPLADTPGRYLSSGQKRRVALARLALSDGRLWLVDEPTLGLDHAASARLEDRIDRHRRAGGLVVVATHVPIALPGAAVLDLADFAPSFDPAAAA